MADWSKPTLTSTYTNFLTEVTGRDTDLATQFSSGTPTNMPTGSIKWDSAANRWKMWNGTSWAELTNTYALTNLTATTGAFAASVVGSGAKLTVNNATISNSTTTATQLTANAALGISLGVSDGSNSSAYFGHYAGYTMIGTDAGGALSFGTNGFTEAMRISPSQTIGIGTNSPLGKLHIQTSTTAGDLYLGRDYYGTVAQSANSLILTSNGDQGYRAGLGTNNGTGNIVFRTANGTTGNTDRVKIDENGKVILYASGQGIQFADGTTQTTAASKSITFGTPISSPSASTIDFTSIPSTTRRIVIGFSTVSTNGTSNKLIQLGTGGSVITTGYSGTFAYMATGVAGLNASSGFTSRTVVSGETLTQTWILNNIGNNTWIGFHIGSNPGRTEQYIGSTSVTLTGSIDRVRITTVNGTDLYNAGTINISWES